VLWEAQFGDFVNGAQTVIDEFISAGAAKWQQRSGVVMLLPHGYDGQGPDHSSARIERFLTLAAGDAFVAAQPSSPASYFHLLRRHSLAQQHRPLVVFTPKSMLKRKDAGSLPDDFMSGTFRPVIGDDEGDPDSVRTLLLCSGRITWDLLAERKRRAEEARGFAIARVECLYPRPVDELKGELARYPNLERVRWVQDEPANMGPWPHFKIYLEPELGVELELVSRDASASPSVGQATVHQAEARQLLVDAFG
jgi:multifunctional 2-oxoglutarate metabolism enzyme